jgi:hypothetical protein
LDVKNYLKKSLSLFFILAFLFIPLTYYGLNYQYVITNFLFLKTVAFVQNHFFAGAIKHIDFSSDTVGLNILICLLLIIALVLTLVLSLFKIKFFKIIYLFNLVAPYYIAGILLKYGFDKVFKQQFYSPEPNILYTNFGNLSKDILFWSTLGTSYLYSLVTGIIEVLTALLILIKPTRTFGFFISIAVFANILLINFSFDISVKTFTLFLLAAVVFCIYPELKTIYTFFFQHKQVQLLATKQTATTHNKWMQLFLSIALICFILCPYFFAGNFNDDKQERPVLHGAYNITGFIINSDTLNRCDFPYKRFFIHRDGYIIFQGIDDSMIDYFSYTDPAKKQLTLIDYKKNRVLISYTYIDKTGALKLEFNSKKWIINATLIDWKSLPALQDKFHFTVDEIK